MCSDSNSLASAQSGLHSNSWLLEIPQLWRQVSETQLGPYINTPSLLSTPGTVNYHKTVQLCTATSMWLQSTYHHWGERERAPTWWSVQGLCLFVCHGPVFSNAHARATSVQITCNSYPRSEKDEDTVRHISKDKWLKPDFLKKEGKKDFEGDYKENVNNVLKKQRRRESWGWRDAGRIIYRARRQAGRFNRYYIS